MNAIHCSTSMYNSFLITFLIVESELDLLPNHQLRSTKLYTMIKNIRHVLLCLLIYWRSRFADSASCMMILQNEFAYMQYKNYCLITSSGHVIESEQFNN